MPDSLGHLGELQAAGVYGFKCFLLDSGVPEFPPLSPTQLRQAMTEIADFDGLPIVHAEDPDVIAAHAVPHTMHYPDFLGSRPAEAETAAIDTVIAAARETGCRTHLAHLSSAARCWPSPRPARTGVRLSVEPCPHYLTLAAERIADGQTQPECCPPVREAANADQLLQALTEGVIDCVVSNHSPATADLKLLDEGDFGACLGRASRRCSSGCPWSGAAHASVATRSRRSSAGWARRPAAIVGVAGKGRIAVD